MVVVVVKGEIGSTARRGGDGVRYRGGRGPEWFKKDVAPIMMKPGSSREKVKEDKRAGEDYGVPAEGEFKAGVINHAG